MTLAATRYFVDKGLQFVNVNEFLSRELERSGYGTIEIQKTPMGHRVIVHAVRLGMIIGKRGRNIRRLTQELEETYGLESPQLEVHDLENPELNARVMASRLISQIQRGFHFRRAGYSMLRRIMASGARGCEITINGKLTSQRARSESFRAGFVAKCGEPAEKFVDSAVLSTTMKQGVIGVHVRIMLPGAALPDEAILRENPFPDVAEVVTEKAVEESELLLEEEEEEMEVIEEITDIEEETVEDKEAEMELGADEIEPLEDEGEQEDETEKPMKEEDVVRSPLEPRPEEDSEELSKKKSEN